MPLIRLFPLRTSYPSTLRALGMVAVAASVLLMVPTDAGPPTLECLADGSVPEWRGCNNHQDCPSGALCGSEGQCTCACSYGEICEDAGCHCAAAPLDVPSGCWGVTGANASSCSGTRSLVCWDAGSCPQSLDCAEPASCTTACSGRCLDGQSIGCVGGVCVCPDAPPRPRARGGCAVVRTLDSTPPLALGLLSLVIVVRRWRRVGSAC